MDALGVREIRDGVVNPTIRVASHPGKLLMGVFDGDGRYVEDTALDRRAGEQGFPVPPGLFPAVVAADAPEAIYAGPLYYHFGHFLLESLARAWYAARWPHLPFVFAGEHLPDRTGLTRWQLDILSLLGITNPTQVNANPTRFRTLHIPDIGYRYDDWFHPEHAAFLGCYEGPAQIRGRRLWLSRSETGSEARDLNAEPTERRLAHAGWRIAYPEQLTIAEQLEQLAQAEVVAGEEGSAFHALVLLKDVTAKKLRIIRRYGREHRNMHTVGDVRQLDQTFHSLERERVLRAEGRFVTKVSPSSSEVLDILDVRVPPPLDPAAATAEDTLLVRVLGDLEPQRFLDVGAQTPHLVTRSTAQSRVAVSPSFRFDPRSYADSGVDFYELELSRYAEHFHGDGERFDVIRLSGTDFGQIMVAFLVSQRLAADGATWILGSGDLAARVAVAVRLAYPGYTAKRLFLGRSTVYVAERVPAEPIDAAGVGELPLAEVRKRARWLPPAGLRLRKLLDRRATRQGPT